MGVKQGNRFFSCPACTCAVCMSSEIEVKTTGRVLFLLPFVISRLYLFAREIHSAIPPTFQPTAIGLKYNLGLLKLVLYVVS